MSEHSDRQHKRVWWAAKGIQVQIPRTVLQGLLENGR